MSKIADRMLGWFVPKATVSAACRTTRTCVDCPAPSQRSRTKTVTLCLNEPPITTFGSCGSC